MGFFKGLSASYVGCFEGAIQWVLYEKMKLFLQISQVGPATIPIHAASATSTTSTTAAIPHATARMTSLSAAEYFFIAAGSKFLAILATYPHEVVRTRLREQAANGAFKYSGFFRTLATIAREEGRRYTRLPATVTLVAKYAVIIDISVSMTYRCCGIRNDFVRSNYHHNYIHQIFLFCEQGALPRHGHTPPAVCAECGHHVLIVRVGEFVAGEAPLLPVLSKTPVSETV
jgi:hypothetical protein